MKKLFANVALSILLLMIANVVSAHHGRGSTYDTKKELPLKGTVAEMLWRNPHITIFVDVKDEAGKVTRWAIEHSNITRLALQGYGKSTLKPGQPVTAIVNPSAAGEPLGLCLKIVLADGKEIFHRGQGVE